MTDPPCWPVPPKTAMVPASAGGAGERERRLRERPRLVVRAGAAPDAQICADHDLTSVQATLLCVIKDRPQGMGEPAQELGVAKNALSGLVDRMERRGLVQRETRPHDRRAITLGTTALGKEIVSALYADVSGRMPDIASALPADEREQLAASVARITASARLTAGGKAALAN